MKDSRKPKTEKKPKNETLAKLLPIVLIIAGITLFGEGVGALAAQAGYEKTSAVIAEITEERYVSGGREKTALSAVAAYTVGDTAYESDLGGVRGGMIEGAQTYVLVNRNDPRDAMLPQTTGGAVCAGLGAALLISGAVWFLPLLREIFAAGEKKEDLPGRS